MQPTEMPPPGRQPATGRAKDHPWLVMFAKAGIADIDRLRDILARHSLLEAWAKFENRFLQR